MHSELILTLLGEYRQFDGISRSLLLAVELDKLGDEVAVCRSDRSLHRAQASQDCF